jgi:hypothetical protein
VGEKELLSTTRMQAKASKAAIVYEFIKHLVNIFGDTLQ